MYEVFRTVLVLSLKASWAVLAVILMRFVLKSAPKWTHCLLWGVVGLRLVLPFSVESRLSLVPQQKAVETVFFSDPIFEKMPAVLSGTGAENSTVRTIVLVIWLLGVVSMLVYAVVSYLVLYRRVAVSVCVERNILICDDIDKPFILGIFRPRICLPSGMDDEQTTYVLLHERAHLSRGDHIIKPLSFLLVAVHWFNPILWLAYKLVGQDIELACDEKTVKVMDITARKAYSETLLTCGMERTMLFACPVAFGEVGVQERIVSVLRYRRCAVWRTLAAMVLCLMLSVSFLTDPVTASIADVVTEETAPELVTKVPENSKVVGTVTLLDGFDLNTKGIFVDRIRCCPYVESEGMEMTYLFTESSAIYEYYRPANCDRGVLKEFYNDALENSDSSEIKVPHGMHVHLHGDVFAAIRCKNCGSELAAYYVGTGTYCELWDDLLR